MKKISLKNLNLKEVEQLSREQLKDVLGGWTGGTTGGGTTGSTQPEMQTCHCGPGCDVIALASRSCADVCAGYDCEVD